MYTWPRREEKPALNQHRPLVNGHLWPRKEEKRTLNHQQLLVHGHLWPRKRKSARAVKEHSAMSEGITGTVQKTFVQTCNQRSSWHRGIRILLTWFLCDTVALYFVHLFYSSRHMACVGVSHTHKHTHAHTCTCCCLALIPASCKPYCHPSQVMTQAWSACIMQTLLLFLKSEDTGLECTYKSKYLTYPSSYTHTTHTHNHTGLPDHTRAHAHKIHAPAAAWP